MSKFENGLLSSAAVTVEKDINAAGPTVVEETEAFSLSIRRSAGLVSIKEDGMVCEISASLSHTFGSAERFDLISAAVDRHVYPFKLSQLLSSGKAELRLRDKSGEIFWARLSRAIEEDRYLFEDIDIEKNFELDCEDLLEEQERSFPWSESDRTIQ